MSDQPNPDCPTCDGEGIDGDPYGMFDYPCMKPCEDCWKDQPMTEITQADRDAADKHGLWLLDDEREDLAAAFARHRQYGYDQGYYDGRQYDGAEERAKIVAWLRKLSGHDVTTSTFQDRRLAYQLAALDFSNAIEAGEHLK